MKSINFIHAADLHLDSPFVGLKQMPDPILGELRAASFRAFQHIIREAIIRKVDFILLAGDLYDGANRNLRTQILFRKEMERLQQHDIQVYIIHGNHDHLGGDWISLQQPDNVHVFGSECEVKEYTKQETKVFIYGYSYPSQRVVDRIIKSYHKKEGADYHIGMLHGNVEGESEHSSYAPFSVEELVEKDFDYWALGHIHKRQELLGSPPIIYPGNTQGRHRKESGLKGCYYVSLSGKHADLQFIPTSQIIWEAVKVELQEDKSFDDLLTKCRTIFQELRNQHVPCFIHLQIWNYNDSLTVKEEELLEILQQEEEYQETFMYPYRVDWKDCRQVSIEHQPLLAFIQQYDWTELDVNEAIQPLFRHALGRKLLTPLTSEEKRELLNEAQEMLLSHLSRGGE